MRPNGSVIARYRNEVVVVGAKRSATCRQGAPDVTIPDVFERRIYSDAQTIIITVSNESIGARNSRRSKRV